MPKKTIKYSGERYKIWGTSGEGILNSELAALIKKHPRAKFITKALKNGRIAIYYREMRKSYD
jgi:hypothetical protein